MKKKFIALAVTGLLLATSTLYAKEAGAHKGLMYQIHQELTSEQREKVKLYIKQNAPQHKALAAKLKQDRLALYSIITSDDIDESQLKKATLALQSDESEVIKNHVGLLHFIYKLADSQQQAVIAPQIKEILQHDRHHLSSLKKA